MSTSVLCSYPGSCHTRSCKKDAHLINEFRLLTKDNKQNGQIFIREEAIFEVSIQMAPSSPVHHDQQKMQETWALVDMKADVCTLEHPLRVSGNAKLLFKKPT